MEPLSLSTRVVTERLLRVLRDLMGNPLLAEFYLVGGTSLALRFGHRRSVDIDLFTHEDFDALKIAEELLRDHELKNVSVETNTIRGSIKGIRLDLIAHKYPLLAILENWDGIRMASLPDVAAMKLNAITNRGSKKDFWDYSLLLDHFSTRQMVDFFSKKYQIANIWHVEKSLLYFDDAEHEPDPFDFTCQDWSSIKKKIISSTCASE
jgi:predicted nucleotidyltransferase component of viral defense system